jgi:hypothetical protein
MNVLRTILAVLLSASVGFAATSVPPGAMTGSVTWTLDGSPYTLSGSIVVQGDLRIEPGVVVQSVAAAEIQVMGYLVAEGTADQPILFKESATGSKWMGLHFYCSPGLAPATGSILLHCGIQDSKNSGIWIENSLPVIDDCVIAKNNSNTSQKGGGLRVENPRGNVQLNRCDIVQNENVQTRDGYAAWGGGIYVDDGGTGSLILVECNIIGNVCRVKNVNPAYAAYGGGICAYGSLKMDRCQVISNRIESISENDDSWNGAAGITMGAGIYADPMAGTIEINRSIIRSNHTKSVAEYTAKCLGSGAYLAAGIVVIENTIVSGNSCEYSLVSGQPTLRGIGLYLDHGEIENCTIVQNKTGIYSSGNTRILNSIVYFNETSQITQGTGSPNVRFCDIQGWTGGGAGNMDADPKFACLYELRISPDSPCVDAGDDSDQQNYNDVCFPPSLGTARNDMGAHGGPGACGSKLWSPDCNENGIPDECDIRSGVDLDENGDGIPDGCYSAWLEGVGSLCYNIVVRHPEAILGADFALDYDPDFFQDVLVDRGFDLPAEIVVEACPGDCGPSDLDSSLCVGQDGGPLSGIVIGLHGPVEGDQTPPIIQAGTHRLLQVCFTKKAGAPVGGCAAIDFASCLKLRGLPVGNIVVVEGPAGIGQSVPLAATGLRWCGDRFRRGDANLDGRFDMGDPITILLHLFAGGTGFEKCMDAADANDDGDVNISDAVYLIDWRYKSDDPPPQPFPSCDEDPTPGDGFTICEYPSC